ncbi:hypothetical protein B0H14DRAFT_2606526 [Mycena olivaceomarginata]|nr:hypothetical protein B0H14DRAFT_2606526 [Mycena olivaceomarginata]
MPPPPQSLPPSTPSPSLPLLGPPSPPPSLPNLPPASENHREKRRTPRTVTTAAMTASPKELGTKLGRINANFGVESGSVKVGIDSCTILFGDSDLNRCLNRHSRKYGTRHRTVREVSATADALKVHLIQWNDFPLNFASAKLLESIGAVEKPSKRKARAGGYQEGLIHPAKPENDEEALLGTKFPKSLQRKGPSWARTNIRTLKEADVRG